MSTLPSSTTVALPSVSSRSQDVLQSARLSLEPPKADEVWSAWYKEAEDKFLDFRSFDAAEGAAAGGGPASAAGPRSSSHRTLSARQISGQFEEEVVQSWEEDWEDEDVEDTFDAIMGQIARYEATAAASSTKERLKLFSKTLPPDFKSEAEEVSGSRAIGASSMWMRTLIRLCSSKPPGTAPAAVGNSWMTAAAWASLGSEFADVREEKFLRPRPDGFLTPRATTDVVPAEELLHTMTEENAERYKGIDVRDPSSMAVYEGERPQWMTLGSQTRAVSEFISGHLCHHISLPEWKKLFDLQYAEMDLTYWLYVLHVHMVSRRATSIPIDKFNRRREVLEEILLTMFDSWAATSEDIMGRPPLNKIRFYIKDMYYVTAINFEEALLHDGAGADLMLLGFLMKFCPLPRPEDVPMFTYYSLVHYIRFHTALLDRISDEAISMGNFNFLSPTDPRIFEQYDDVALDNVIRSWTVEEANETTERTAETAEATEKAN